MNETEKKMKMALSLIKTACKTHPYKIAFSGGKDSVVIDFLAKEAGFELPKIYNSTTIDPPGTIKFCLDYGCIINRPAKSFLQLVEEKGLPTMFRRFCCRFLKEQYVADFLIMGIRKAESVKRNKRYCDFEAVINYSKKRHTTALYPILHMNDEDISYIVETFHLKCHPLYYDDYGYFHVERRLGCIGCPLKGDRGVSELMKYTGLLRQITKRLIKFHEAQGRTAQDAYLNLVYNLFYSNHKFKQYQQTYQGLFAHDPKQFLEDYFKIDLP